MDIRRLLPKDYYDANLNAASPSALNPFATIADLPAPTGDGIYSGNGIIPTLTVATLTDTFSIGTNLFKLTEGTNRVELAMDGGNTYMGTADNYFRQNVQTTTQFSNSALRTGFHANRDGNGISLLAGNTTRSHIDVTSGLFISTLWNNNPQSPSSTLRMVIGSDGGVGIGLGYGGANENPAERLRVRGKGDTAATTLVIFESLSGTSRFIQNDEGQIGTGSNISALISTSFGQYHQATGYSFGYGFYPNNCGTGLTVQMKGTTNIGYSVAHQGNPTGIVKGFVSTIGGTNASQNYGMDSIAEDATVINVGVKGRNSNNSNAGSLINAGVYGVNDPRINYDAHGGLFEVYGNNGAVVFTSVDLIGLEGRSLGGTNVGNTGVKSIGGKFSAIRGDENIAILIPEINAQNNGVAVFGANNRNGDSILQVTGDIEILGVNNGLIMEDSLGSGNRCIVYVKELTPGVFTLHTNALP